MPKQPQNSGKKWTSVEERNLKNLISQNTHTRVIGLKLKRTPRINLYESGFDGMVFEADESISLQPSQ